jgi:predicted enzyme related to lactoylglutathione lyase
MLKLSSIMLFSEDPKRLSEFYGLGTRVVAEPYRMGEGDMWIATFADPDGNYFQLMSPWEPKPAD